MSSAVLQHPGARRPQASGGGKAASEELVYSVRADSFSNGIEAREEGGDDPAEMVYRWDFNVFDFSKKAKDQHVLLELVQILLEDYGLLNGWKLDPNKVVAYFLKVEEIYRANPYHNKTHAADVTQTAAMIMQALDQGLLCPSSSSCSHNSNHHQEQLHLHLQPSLQPQHHHQHQDNSPSSSTTAAKVGCFARCCGGSSSAAVAPSVSSKQQEQQQPESQPQLQQQQPQSHLLPSKGCGCRRLRRVLQSLSKLEAFSIIFASAVHDLGHPGVNNAFLIKTRNEQAIIHNDRSVNENMHACLAFQLAFSSPELNIFENFSTAEFEQMRKLVLDMVLSTDMDVHFALLKRFDDAVLAVPDLTTWTSIEQRSLMFQMLVHLADLANPSRPWHLALTWAEWVVTEFLGQGAREAEAGIPVSDFCNKDKVCMPNAQLFFIERFMQPTLETFRPAAPAFYQLALPWLNDTKSKWQAFKAAGVRLPHEEYPTLPAPAAPVPPAAFEGHRG